MTPRILIVEDEPEILGVLVQLLSDTAEVVPAPDAEQALALLSDHEFDVVLTDLKLPGASGLDLARSVRARHPFTEVLVLTGHADLEVALEALRIGVAELLQKPVGIQEAEAAIHRAIEKRRLFESLERAQTSPDPAHGLAALLGESAAMRRLRSAIVRVQNTDAPVLVVGETGTGKELVARALHQGGHRSRGPFLAINCAALSAELLESELFGFEGGSFTGASGTRPGLLEEARGGTFFLDEIGELPLALQAKLLRALQEREVLRVGGREPRKLDVRIVSATNRDLGAEVSAGRFRADLYFRISTFPIRTPPLAEIPEDLPLLARHFVSESARVHGLRAGRLSEDLLVKLSSRRWPGNVRELQNLMFRLVLLGEGSIYTVADLEAAEAEAATVPASTCLDPRWDFSALFAEGRLPTLEDLAEAYTERVLAYFRGRQKEAARVLGIHPVTLSRKLSSRSRRPSYPGRLPSSPGVPGRFRPSSSYGRRRHQPPGYRPPSRPR